MPISNMMLRVVPLLGACLLGARGADQLTLAADGARLTGTVRVIGADGVLMLESPLAPGPLRLKDGAVRKVEFAASTANSTERPDAIVELANGDSLPAAVVSLKDAVLTVDSPAAGRLEIPRAALSSLQLGISDLLTVYSGPRNLAEWKGIDGSPRNMTYENGNLIADGSAAAAKKVDMPRDFIVRFTVAWEPRQNPNIQFYFADPLLAQGEPADRYYVQFGGAGLEIKRESSRGQRWRTITALNRLPNNYPERELTIEIHVSRSASRLHLFLNGEPEGWGEDPAGVPPEGGGIAIVCNGSRGNPQHIREIQVLELDDSRLRHRSEDRGDPKRDSLISRDEERWGGSLREIAPLAEGPLFRFKSEFQDDLIEIPEAEVSTVFFASAGKDESEAAEAAAPRFLLRLRGDGELRVESCQIEGEAVTVAHPLLGNIRIARDSVLALERDPDQQPTAPES